MQTDWSGEDASSFRRAKVAAQRTAVRERYVSDA